MKKIHNFIIKAISILYFLCNIVFIYSLKDFVQENDLYSSLVFLIALYLINFFLLCKYKYKCFSISDAWKQSLLRLGNNLKEDRTEAEIVEDLLFDYYSIHKDK